MSNITNKEKYASIKEVGMKGISSLIDPQNINDNELMDARNIVFDNGVISPRGGSAFLLAKPTGETSKPTQILVTHASDGIDFIIGVWGINFYLYDSVTPQWIKINGSVVPTISGSGVWYGGVDWNTNKNNDLFYFCNGTDQFVKWQTSIGYIGVTTAAGDSVIQMTNSSRFPAGGGYSVIIQNGGSQIIAPVTSATDTTITLTGTVGDVVTAGSAITIQCVNVSAIPKGNILSVYTDRLFVAGNKNASTLISYSKVNLPEDFGTSADTLTGGYRNLFEGIGGVTDMQNFGTFLLLCKKNSLFNFSFILNSSVNAQITQVTPLVYGTTTGPYVPYLNLTVENEYYYPTFGDGIYKISPLTTGTSTTVGTNYVSSRMSELTNNDNFSFLPGRVCSIDRKIYWLGTSLATTTTNKQTLTNNLTIVYDLQWDAWTIFDNWDAVDIKTANGDIYFISKDNGDLCVANQRFFQDFGGEDKTVGYTSYAVTKRWDFDLPSQVKTLQGPTYIQGYIDPSTTLFIDVLYNEKGGLSSQRFKIIGNNPNYVSLVSTPSLGDSILGGVTLGGVLSSTTTQNGNLFRVYLDTTHSLGFYNIQFKFYTEGIGSNWAVSYIGFDPFLEGKVPTELLISPS